MSKHKEQLTFSRRILSLLPGSSDRPPRMSLEEISNFARQMATMIQAGIPLLNALMHISSGSEGDVHKITSQLVKQLSRGKSLSRSMQSFPTSFSPMSIGLIETAEQSGQLAKSFNRWASIAERNLDMTKKLKSILVYPAFLLVSAALCVVFFTVWIIPMMEPLLADLGQELPLPTQMLLLFRVLMPYLLGICFIGGLAVWVGWPWIQSYIAQNRSLQNRLDNIPLQLPWLGETINKMISASILESFNGLIESGFPVTIALEKASRTTSNTVFQDRISKACFLISEGNSIADALEEGEVFPNTACQMIAVGEESGNLSNILQRVANYFDQEVEWAISSISNIIEPIIMVVIGAGVGFIVLASILPTIQLLNKL